MPFIFTKYKRQHGQSYGGKKMIWFCDLVRSTSTTTMMNEISKNVARIMRYLENKLELFNLLGSHYSCDSCVYIAPIWLWDIFLALHSHSVFTFSWAGLYITGRQSKCFWVVNVCFHTTSCHWFQIFQPFCPIGHSFHEGHTEYILPLPQINSSTGFDTNVSKKIRGWFRFTKDLCTNNLVKKCVKFTGGSYWYKRTDITV